MAKGRAAALVAALTKAKDYAREHPEQTSGYLDKVEGFVRAKAGPKHAGAVDKGGRALRTGLGLPTDGAGPASSTEGSGGRVPPPPPPDGSSDGHSGR